MTVQIGGWLISASALILVVLLLRGLLGKRIGAGLRYGLWLVVLVRLLVPAVFFSLPIPILPSVKAPEALRVENIYVLPVDSRPREDSGVRFTEDGEVERFGDVGSFGYPRLENEGRTVTRYADKISPLELLGWIWTAGAVVMAAALITANARFTLRLRRVRRPLEGTAAPVPVYVASSLPSPCLVGMLRPAVYVTEEAAGDPAMLRHVLAHELTHYNHRDHLWSVLRGAALTVHWWNPLVWLAVMCSRRDGELACDEGALKRLGDKERSAYGETLLALVTAKSRPADLLSFATTMTGGKRSLRERIQRIASQPKRLVSAMVVVIVVLSLSFLVAFGQAKEADVPDDDVNREAPEAHADRPDNAWRTAEITLDEDGVPHIDYQYGDTMEFLSGAPIPAPREWADQDLAGRSEATALQYSPDVWAKLVSPTDGWLVACYGRGVAAADTYVYRTEDGGMTWTEVAKPGTDWHIADVGFLSPDRLIVAQKLFDGAPCFITKDGGKSWEEIELPDTQVLDIGIFSDADVVYMDIGAHEGGPATSSMISSDWGDTWSTSFPAGLRRFVLADLDHDGLPDMLTLLEMEDAGLVLWQVQFTASYMSSPTWTGEAASPHVGWTSFYLCRMDGEDYLLEYSPWMGGGSCEYRYKLFYLTARGEEVVVQENTLEFDLIFGSDYVFLHQFDPQAINTFMEEINALLAKSEVLINTDENLLGTFEKEGRLYDSLWWLDDDRDENLSLLENLENFGTYAQDHPDDTWSPLADVLLNLTADDITGLTADADELEQIVQYLRSAERGSRFYTWDTYNAAYEGHMGDESTYGLYLALEDGSSLDLRSREESDNVLMILEMPGNTEVYSAFYVAPELGEYIRNIDVTLD